jgi:cytoskeletal protein CcmA (bactofilin family)
MRRVDGKLLGPVVIHEDTDFHGMIDGEARVGPGVTFLVHGMIAGDLRIERDATVELRGMVAGSAFNRGKLIIYGVVRGLVHNEDAGSASVVTDAVRR